ncbi:MAG TPA: hypothetical protein VGW38_06215 [Chloroflexota bacterium]|nr:hypothetical protein [Chloroflexota bacterium]
MQQVKVRQCDGETEPLAFMVNPMRGFHMGHPPLERTPHPSVLVRQFGKGRVVYLSAPVDAVYGEYGHPDYKRLLVNAVRWAAGSPPPVEVEAPTTVEAVAREHGDDGKGGDRSELRVHLVNRTAAGPARARSSVLQEHFPVHDLTLRVRQDRRFSTATLQPEGKRLEMTQENGVTDVRLPRLDTYSIVVLA